MTWLRLPADSTLDAEFFVELDGTTYGFRTYWNARNASWFLDILDSEGSPLVQTKRIGVDSVLSKNVPSMPGLLTAVSMDTLDSADPGRDDLGVRVLLMYRTADDA